ncbi:MAG: hypothetical protein ACKVI3_08985 [Verrucomicrobiia bacterium]
MLSHPRKARTRLGQVADGGLLMLAARRGLRAARQCRGVRST